ncbi:class I adenylate-forming enzyme family protein [Paenibacillus lutrae]|uniref:AMP-binding protein n=1 Tax=Paenibacillus lutrae TaxID=2078573 RepID=A0A7X3FFZ1_9BACL|nr:class I adenylate-forming enzyme family protein [Paenibacillus lutrae]MVO98877.1 AMP-binding protein [Paenibacillus lutrae]
MDSRQFFSELYKHGGVCAADGTGGFMTYKQLRERMEQNAQILTRLGFGKSNSKGQQLLAVDVSLGFRVVPVYLAALLLNITLIPVDPLRNPALSDKILRWTKAELYITDSSLDSLGKILPGSLPGTIPSHRQELSEVAVVLYTSGTTGRPKGVMLTYGNIWSNLRSILDYFTLTPKDRLYLFRPLTYASAFTGELLPALYKGAAVYFKPGDINPIGTMKSLARDGITALGVTPTVAAAFARFRSRYDFSGLRYLILSGECLSAAHAEQITAAFPAAGIWNAYGLTEASPRISCLTEAGAVIRKKGCVGRPLAGVKVKVADSQGRPVPEGQEGILYAAGPNIMKGYYGDPEATARKITDGWLCTGDRAVIREGEIYVLGRSDFLLIRGGINMDPSEIESELTRIPQIREALVFGETSEGRTRVHAWITCDSGAEIPQIRSTIIRTIRDSRLWPDVIEIKQELPKTASGKLIRPINP